MNFINRTGNFLIAMSLNLALLGFMPVAHAMDAIAKVIVSVGKVEALSTDGKIRPLKRRSAVFNTDTVMTSEDSKVQMRFTDGSMLALKPDSRFAVESYQYQVGDDDGKAVYNLLKGGMQTITGAIGRKNKANYALKTPTATIGIRGTYYQLKTCQGDCFNVAGEPQPDGLYGGVKDGAINITNKSGTYTINVGQYFYLAGPDAPVVMLDKPPAILGAVEGSKEGKRKPASAPAGKGASAGSTDDAPEKPASTGTPPAGGGGESPPIGENNTTPTPTPTPTPVTDGGAGPVDSPAPGVDPTPTGYDPVAGGGPVEEETLKISLKPNGVAVAEGGVLGIAFTTEGTSGQTNRTVDLFTLGGGRTAYFEEGSAALSFLDVNDVGCMLCQLEPGSSLSVDTGGYGSLGVRWARWQGDYNVIENGKLLSPSLGGLHYIYSPDITSRADVVGLSGRARFDFFGGTLPTDQFGNVGVVDPSQSYLVADFDNQVFDSASLGFSLNGQEYLVATHSTTSWGSLLNTDISLSGSGLSGALLTQFVGTSGQGVSGVYNLSDGSSVINGAGLFLQADRLSVSPAGSLAPSGGVLATAYARVDASGVNNVALSSLSLGNTEKVFLNNASAPIYIEELNGSDCLVCQFLAADATLVDTGSNASLGVTWGRWSGDYIVAEDGFELSGLSDNYHFLYSTQLTGTEDVQDITGVATFDYAGGTSPTDQFGNEGVVDPIHSYLVADFDRQVFDSASLGFSFNGHEYLVATNSATPWDSRLNAEISLSGSGLSGALLTQFVGTKGQGVSGVYNLSDGSSVINGAGLFLHADRLSVSPVGSLAENGVSLATAYYGSDPSGTIKNVVDRFTTDGSHQFYLNDALAPTYIEQLSINGCLVCQFDSGSASLLDSGSYSALGASWGRWNNGFVAAADGFKLASSDNYHYIYGSDIAAVSVVNDFTGTASFDFVGGTAPTDQLGNVGVVDAAKSFFKVDFDSNQFEEASFAFNVGGSAYQLSNTGPVAIGSSFDTVVPLLGSGFSGQVSTQFVGVSGLGLSGVFSFNNGSSYYTSVGLFERPAPVVAPLPVVLTRTGSLSSNDLSFGMAYLEQAADGSVNTRIDMFTTSASNQVYLDGSMEHPVFMDLGSSSDCNGCQFSQEGAALVDGYIDGSTWGRWSGAFKAVESQVLLTVVSDLAYNLAAGGSVTSFTNINNETRTAAFNMTVSSGGPGPMDQAGNVGTLDTSNSVINVNFATNQFTGVNLEMDINATHYQFSNASNVAISSSLVTGVPLTGNGMSGKALLQFIDLNGVADGLNTSFGMSGGGNAVVGTAYFEDQSIGM